MTNRTDLPLWRRPLPPHHVARDRPATDLEPTGIREALYDLTGPEPMTFGELAAQLRELWGEAAHIEIAAQLSALVRSGAIRRVRDGWARVEPEEVEAEL